MPANPPSPLRHIEGKYEILAKLKEGGMGAIYKVRHRLLDEVRVVKLMRPQLTEDLDLKERFVREARFAIRLRHPNVAQLYDFTIDDEDGTAFIVMEFIDGINLAEVLATSGPPSLGLTLEIAEQSLRALGYLHGKGFVHRDISPDNLILTAGVDGEPLVKLIDLGIAKTVGAGSEGLTQTGMFLGKVRYSSPEQFGMGGAAQMDGRGDLYSFGIVFYELLTGRYPIQGQDTSSLIAAHLFRSPLDFAESDPQGSVPPGLREIVLRALAKQPDDRFATAQDFSAALKPFRQRGESEDLELARILSRPSGRREVPAGPVGSTQERLDEQFVLGTTPSRGGTSDPAPEAPPRRALPAIGEATAAIEWEIQRNNAAAAESMISEALETFGEQPELRTLCDRLEGLRVRKIEMEAEDLIARARHLLEGEDLDGAREVGAKAAELDPENPEVKALGSEIRAVSDRIAERERQEAESRRRAERIAQIGASIRSLIEHGDLDGAAAQLAGTAVEPGTEPVLDSLRERLDDLRQQAQRDRQAATERHLAEGRDLLARGSLTAALREFHRAAELAPESTTARQLILAAEGEQKARQLAEMVSGIHASLDLGELDSAEALMNEAEARFGPSEPVAEQRSRLVVERQAREHASATAADSGSGTGTVVGPLEREPSAAPPLLEAPRPVPEVHPGAPAPPSGSVDLPAERAAAERRPDPLPPPEAAPASRLDAASSGIASNVSSRDQPDRSRAFRVLLAVAGLVLALGFGLWFVLFRHPAANPVAKSSPVATTPSATVSSPGSGILILDATPWGEVVEIVDRQGTPQPLGAQRFTPLVVALAPGRYRVTLRHPNFPQPVVLDTEIISDTAVKRVAEFDHVDEEEFFRGMGW